MIRGRLGLSPAGTKSGPLPQSCAVSEQRDLGEQIAVENG
jgi:hypothetical protein